MPQFLVRMEAVNLASSIFDTEDLSTIRGGSFACLELPQKLLRALKVRSCKEVFSGASQAVMVVDVDDDADQASLERQMMLLASGQAPVTGLDEGLMDVLPHITLIGVAVPFSGDFNMANSQALARLRRRQLSQPTIDLRQHRATRASRPCAIDGSRAAMREITKGDESLLVSESVYTRRRLGVQGRQAIYGREIADIAQNINFVDSFLELVERPPAGTPASLSGKMAVIKLDGNKFSSIRDRFIKSSDDPAQAASDFSALVVAARRRFLSSLIKAVKDDDRMYAAGRKLRFETLMWGGDESLFVLPAWKLRDILSVIASDMAAEHWSLPHGERLTTGYGILVCSAKMPIAIAKSLCESLLEGAKSLNAEVVLDRLSIQTIESIESPTGSIPGLRQQLYKTSESAPFVLTAADGLRRYLEVCDAATDPASGLPRSQLQWLLSQSRQMPAAVSQEDIAPVLRDAIIRSRAAADGKDVVAEIDRLVSLLSDPILGTAPNLPFLPYQRLAELWDVLRPFPKQTSAETI